MANGTITVESLRRAVHERRITYSHRQEVYLVVRGQEVIEGTYTAGGALHACYVLTEHDRKNGRNCKYWVGLLPGGVIEDMHGGRLRDSEYTLARED